MFEKLGSLFTAEDASDTDPLLIPLPDDPDSDLLSSDTDFDGDMGESNSEKSVVPSVISHTDSSSRRKLRRSASDAGISSGCKIPERFHGSVLAAVHFQDEDNCAITASTPPTATSNESQHIRPGTRHSKSAPISE